MDAIKKAMELIQQTQQNHFKAWKDAEDKFDDPIYGEEYHDTLQRKYDEGSADALQFVIELLSEINFEEIQKDIATNSAQDVLVWLEEVYGEGIRATGAWQTYMEDEEEENPEILGN